MALRADDVDLVRDRALVVRYQSGDGAAFDDLYRRYFSRLRRFCERRVGDPHEAEELAQEAFTKALRAMPQFAGERRFYPWMTVIASRLCVDSHRRRQRSTPVAEVELGSVEPDLDDLFAESDRADLERAFGRLAPRHREVLELRERDGWSYQRIADHYDVTLGTVEALLHRARRALRREFSRVSAPAVVSVLWGRLGRRIGDLARRASSADPAGLLAQALPVIAVGTMYLAPNVWHASASPADGARDTLRHTTLTTSVGVPSSAATVDTVASTVSASATGGDQVTAPPTPTPPRASVPRVEVLSRSEAAARAESQPVHLEAAGVSVGVNPEEIVRDVASMLQERLRRNP